MLALISMATAQLGLAGSVLFLGALSAEGAASLRLAWAALLIVVIVRPWRHKYTISTIRNGIILGVATAGMSILFMAAAVRIPLGTASAIEFLGPLCIAALTRQGRHSWVWPLSAAIGVLLLTQPWQGSTDLVGICFAAAGACCYAGYILFTQRIGDSSDGLKGLGISMPIAAVVAIPVAGLETFTALTVETVLVGLTLAALVPFLPFILELFALRRLTTAAFATLMCFEPAFALLAGLFLLGQVPNVLGILGIACVIIAGIGATRTGSRQVLVE
ncbi:EamA family transporter [Glutamicibacter sp. NPDC087344]|uniref:EamA family transporter n=1 Tax=Glutamicibacter sp. NPDC087344 TaxID=3363994 RepID=UPI0038072016